MDRLKPFGGARNLFGFQNNKSNKAWLAAIINSSSDAIISKTLDGKVTSWNPAAERMFGYSEAEMLHVSIRRIIPVRLQEEEDAILETVRKGETVSRFETFRMDKEGREVPVAMTVSPICDEDGEVVGASNTASDISQEVRSREEIAESEARFRTLADNISQLAWMADPDGIIYWYNKRWYEYTGTTLEDNYGWGWKNVHHPDYVDGVAERIQHSWTTGEDWEDTFPLRSSTGEYRWFLSRALPERNEKGEITRWLGTNTDITEQRDREEQIRFLMREVFHRSKNMLSLVQGIARQTIPPENRAFLSTFNQRIQALSSSQNLLLEAGAHGTSLIELIHSQLGHIEDDLGDRIRKSGEDVQIDSRSAQTLGMALHELATNAGKYGALSNDTGIIELTWSLQTVEGEDRPALHMQWTESGGPPVIVPERKGFGTTVLERMSRAAFGGEVTLDYGSEGFVWTLTGAPGRGLEIEDMTEPA